MNNTLKNIVAILFAFVVVGIAYHLVQQRDEKIMSSFSRWGTMNDSLAMQPTNEEQRIALQFSDTTLPQLKQLGLVKCYTRTEIETIITVSGRIWNERSAFFKESLLEQIFTYNKVNGFAVKTKIIDNKTARLYAEITPPDQRLIF